MAVKKSAKTKKKEMAGDKTQAEIAVTEIVGGEGIKVEDTVKPKETVVKRSDVMPCPYCGAPAVVVKTTDYGSDDVYAAKCTACNDGGAMKRGLSEEYVVWEWNRASIEIGLRDEVGVCMRMADELLARHLIYVEIVEKSIIYRKSANDVVARTNVEKLSRRDITTFAKAKAEFARRVMNVVRSFRNNKMTTIDGVTIEMMICKGKDEKLRVNKLDFDGFDLPVPYAGVTVNRDTVKDCVLGFEYLKSSVKFDDDVFTMAAKECDAGANAATDGATDDKGVVWRCLEKACGCVSEEAKVFMEHCRDGQFLSRANDRERIAIKVDDMIADMRKAGDVKPADCLRLAAALVCLAASSIADDQDMMDDIQSVLENDIHGSDETVRQLEKLWK